MNKSKTVVVVRCLKCNKLDFKFYLLKSKCVKCGGDTKVVTRERQKTPHTKEISRVGRPGKSKRKRGK